MNSELERAVEKLTEENWEKRIYRCPYCGARDFCTAAGFDSAIETALKALRAEIEREGNAPLTIEEILNMSGKPVWCQTGDGYEGWALVIVDKYKDGGHYLYLFSDDLTRDGIDEAFEPDEDFINLTYDDPVGHFGLHALGWRAYRREPNTAEREGKTCDGCEWQPNMMGVTRCQKCARFPLPTDRYEPKGAEA